MKKKLPLAALAMAGILGASVWFQPLAAYAAVWEKSGSGYEMPDGTSIRGVLRRGIDVSHWQQNVDWNQVAADDVDFVMLGTRYKGEVDPNFRTNADAAHAAGVELGAYIYSYATSVEMAEQEADFILDLVKDYPISYPIAFDAEDAGTLGTLPPDQISAIINAFCRKIEAAGYYPMVYANEYWLNNKIDKSTLDYDVWVARYNVMYTYDSPAIWQATNTGSVNGIAGNVDIDFQFKDYASVIPANTWREIAGKRYYYQNYAMQKNSWINDGNGWYYMNESGNPSTGWKNLEDGDYYLAQDGRMQTGWQELDGSWYYFKDSGRMALNWQQVDGIWYYLGTDGKRRAGWQDIDGGRYYLGTDGRMASGWQKIDESWYYLGTDGKMTTGWQDIDGKRYYLGADGRMETGWKQMDGHTYYLNSDGSMAVGWKQSGDTWYYMNGEGHMQTGWIQADGALYYLNDSGAMAANTVLERDGVKYQAAANGVCTEIPAENAAEGQAGDQSQAGTEGSQNAEGQSAETQGSQNTGSGPAGPASDTQ